MEQIVASGDDRQMFVIPVDPLPRKVGSMAFPKLPVIVRINGQHLQLFLGKETIQDFRSGYLFGESAAVFARRFVKIEQYPFRGKRVKRILLP